MAGAPSDSGAVATNAGKLFIFLWSFGNKPVGLTSGSRKVIDSRTSAVIRDTLGWLLGWLVCLQPGVALTGRVGFSNDSFAAKFAVLRLRLAQRAPDSSAEISVYCKHSLKVLLWYDLEVGSGPVLVPGPDAVARTTGFPDNLDDLQDRYCYD